MSVCVCLCVVYMYVPVSSVDLCLLPSQLVLVGGL